MRGLSTLSLGAAAAVTLMVSQASAAEFRPFNEKEFAAAQAAGKPILVDVAASWCPVCKAQKPVIDKLAAEPRFDKLMVFHLDFDQQKPQWRALGASRQSTLIAFRGSKETGRSVGDADPKSIERLLASTN